MKYIFIDEAKIEKFSRGEQQILERYRFHSDITESQQSQHKQIQQNKTLARLVLN